MKKSSSKKSISSASTEVQQLAIENGREVTVTDGAVELSQQRAERDQSSHEQQLSQSRTETSSHQSQINQSRMEQSSYEQEMSQSMMEQSSYEQEMNQSSRMEQSSLEVNTSQSSHLERSSASRQDTSSLELSSVRDIQEISSENRGSTCMLI